MNADQKAAFVIAQTEMMRAESEIMKAENLERERKGLSPANGPDQWQAFANRWEPVLGYNALLNFFD